jgi:hypothetical protein
MMVGHSASAVPMRARKLRKYVRPLRAWTPEEMKLLRENIYIIQRKKLGQLLKRTIDSIYHKAAQLGLIQIQFHRWTLDEQNIIKLWYGKIPNKELAKKLGVSKGSLIGKARTSGVPRRTPTSV